MLPTFLIAGAAKAGTTTLWYLLNEHPQVYLSPLKEPDYFSLSPGCGSQPDPRASRFSGNFHKGLAWYESLFRNHGGARAVGEASVMYMADEDAPRLIYETIPEVQILFILRDPVDRIFSHYWQERRHGWSIPSFEDMVREAHPTLQRYLYVSSYHLLLPRFLELFSRDQIHVFLYDDLQSRPESLAYRLYTAVGVDPSFTPKNLGHAYNPARLPRLARFQSFIEAIDQWWKVRVAREYPVLLQKAAQAIVRLNSREIVSRSMPIELRGQLMGSLGDTIDYVEEYLERDLSSWRQADRR